MSLDRWDNQDSMDQLQLTYNGNQLKKVTDNGFSQNLYSIKEYQDMANLATDFYYDANGNMRTDSDRNVVTIRYNLLNLPDTVQFGNGNQILNKYSADGQKLSTTYVTAPANIVVAINNTVNSQGSNYTRYGTRYNGNIEYEFDNTGNTTVGRVMNGEGYVDFEPGDPSFYFDDRYNYYRKDHLGNVREVWRAPYSVHYMDGGGWGQEVFPAQTVQRTQYYPSGLPWKTNSGDNPGEQPYKYGGKEFVEMHGWNAYDSKARWYLPDYVRTSTPDPHAENYYDTSPYAWCGNNPVNRIDPDGRDNWNINEDGSLIFLKTDDEFDSFFINTTNSDGEVTAISLGQFNKNENGLIQLPSKLSFTDESSGISFGFTVKEGNEDNAYIRGDAFASLFGALSETSTTDLTIIGFSKSDGSSPSPSVSHKNGVNGDLRYLRLDESGGAILLNQKGFDLNRQNTLNTSLNKYGWKDMISERFTPAGSSSSVLLNNTRHYNKSRHHNHLHMQGYKPIINRR